MKTKSVSSASPDELKAVLQQSIADGFTPTLAIVFLSVAQDREAVCDVFRQNNIDCIGATSCNEFVDGHQSEGGIAVLLLKLDKNSYTLLLEEIGGQTLTQAAAKFANAALEKFDNPALILLTTSITQSGAMLDGETLTRSLEKIMGAKANIFGGMAGDDMTFAGTFVFVNGRIADNGMAAIVFDENKIALYGVALSGWKSVGVLRTVSKSHNNLLHEIDGRPALEMYLRYLGEDFDATQDQSKFFDGVGLHYPLQIEREGRQPMMCNPMGYNKEENALVLESDVQEGAKFRFSTPPDFDIVQTVIDKAKEMRSADDAEADAVLIFSCASRLSALGPMAQQENEGLAEVWQAPMAGFYTYGEFGRALNGKHEFHSTTCSWVAIKEK